MREEYFFPLGIKTLCQRIESPVVQGMATEQPTNGAACSTNQPIPFEGLDRKLGARRCKSTGGRQPGRNDPFVALHQTYRNSTRRYGHEAAPRRVSNSERNSAKGCSRADRLGLITQSKPMGIPDPDFRMISRTLRRILFLS